MTILNGNNDDINQNIYNHTVPKQDVSDIILISYFDIYKFLKNLSSDCYLYSNTKIEQKIVDTSKTNIICYSIYYIILETNVNYTRLHFCYY